MSNPNEVDRVKGKYSHVPVVHEAEYTTALENKIQSLELELFKLNQRIVGIMNDNHLREVHLELENKQLKSKLGCDHLDAPYRKLLEENKRLREALEKIAKDCKYRVVALATGLSTEEEATAMALIAKQALEGGKE